MANATTFTKGHEQLNTGRTHFKKGHVPWHAGKKGVMKAWNKGMKMSDEFRAKCTGANRPNYKGGSGTERHQLMQRRDYVLWRVAVFTRDDYTCQLCGLRNQDGLGKTVRLEADHIKPWSLYPDLRYAIDNGRTLCVDCHRQTDTWGTKIKNFEGVNL